MAPSENNIKNMLSSIDSLIENIPIISKNKFHNDIEELIKNSKLSYPDAIIHYCEKNHIEIERVNELVDPQLKSKLQRYYQSVNILPKFKSKGLPL